MKTAISVPDDLFKAGEELARREGLSRSDLYTRALRAFLAQRDRAAVTRRLNEIYDHEPAILDPVLGELQSRSFPEGEW